MAKGVPVVIAANGLGFPVKPVDSGAPLLTVAENGLGAPIVISDNGAPFVVDGLEPPYDPDALALFERFTTPPTPPRKGLINNLIVSLKAVGVWEKLDALYLLAAHDSQAARQNWIANQYNLTAVAAPSFVADRGYQGNGASSYLTSNFNPSTAGGLFTQDNASFGFWSRSPGQIAASAAGWFDGTDGVTVQTRSASDNASVRINQASAASGSNLNGEGLFCAVRTGASAARLDRNGSQVVATSASSTALNNAALRFGSITASSFSTHEFAAGFIGSALSISESSDLYDAISAYLQAVGAA